MVLWLGLVLAGGVDRVPEDFPTIQEAVDRGDGDVISVGAGRWAGARVDRAVVLEGRRGAILDTGVSVGALEVGLWLVEGADGTVVRGLGFDCDAQLDGAVFSSARQGGLARDVVVERVALRRCAQGVSVVGLPGASVDGGWTVRDSRIDGVRTEALRGGSGGGIGVVAYNVSDVDIVGNAFVGWSDDAVDFASAGVVLAGCARCSVVGNRFATEGAQWGHASVVDAGATLRGGLVCRDLVVADNEAQDGAWQGVDVRLHGTEGVLVDNNLAEVWASE